MTDLGRMQADPTRIGGFEVLTPGAFAEGTSWRETRRLGRRSLVLTMTVRTALPLSGYTATGTVGDTECRLTYHLVDQGRNETKVIGVLEYQAPAPSSVLKRFLTTAFGTPAARLLRRELTADLERVDRAALRLTTT